MVALLGTTVMVAASGCSATQASAGRPSSTRPVGAAPGRSAGTRATPSGATRTSATQARLLAAVLRLEATGASSRDATVTTPSCAAPTPPPASSPPASGYEIPFVAAINAELVSGYDVAWVNDNHGYPAWKAIISNIKGWVAGELEIPSLETVAQESDVVFCSSGTPDAPGQIHLELIQGIKKPAPPPIQNFCDNGLEPCTPNFNVEVQLTATTPTSLGVIGVGPGGALQLSGTTSAATVITGLGQTCTQYGPTSLTLSTNPFHQITTQVPDKEYTFAPALLSGPLRQATATVIDNDFTVPAFTGCGLAAAFNPTLAGFGANGNSLYQTGDTTAAPLGWAEFKANVQITSLGLPTGPPADFGAATAARTSSPSTRNTP